jgi:xylulokinase
MKYLVGIDEGTTGTKVCIFNTEGYLVSSAYAEYPSYYPKPGYVEQDIAQITDAFFSTCKEAVAHAHINSEDILAVSLSSQGAAMVLLDENGNVVRNRMIGWQDIRNVEVHDEIHLKITDDEHYAIEGSCVGGFNTGVLVWLQKNEPETWKRVKRIATNQDYFLHQLGANGYPCDIASTQRISMLDVDKNIWSDKLRRVYGCENVELPEIVTQPGKIVGQVTAEISEKTGFPVGCKICVGAQDVNCSSYGVGGTISDIATMVVGTFGGSYIVVDKPMRDPNKTLLVKGNQGMGNWQLEAFSHTAASAFRWFRDKLCSLEIATSSLMGVDPYSLMTEIAEKSVPGANGVTALTCLQGSHGRKVNDATRGTFLGINLSTKKSDLAHAVLEGVCYEMYDILLMQEAFSKPVRTVRLSGGVTKSLMWCQMFADVMNKSIEITESPEAGALGAAMYAGVGIGIYRNCIEAAEKCVRISKVYKPIPENVVLYKAAFDRWNCAFSALNGTFYK